MKKFFCYLLIAALVLGTFAGCKKQDSTGTAGAIQTEHTESPEKKKAFQLVIVHKDGTTKELSLETEAAYLSAALLNAGVVEAEENRFGMHIQKADGEKAVFEEDGAYWAFYVGEEYASKGIYETPATDGGSYKLVYTIG